MKIYLSLLALVSCLLVSQMGFATTTPKPPDPFCSPTDFFKYLKARNQTRVLYVVQNCTNINLSELGPERESFVYALANTNWDDVFNVAINRKDVSFQSVLETLILNKKFPWLLELIKKDELKFGYKESVALVQTFPWSKDLLTQLIRSKKMDPNETGSRYSTLGTSIESLKFDLVEYLRTFPEVDQGPLWPLACSFQVTSDKIKAAQYKAYFKTLVDSGQFDLNTPCAGKSHPFVIALRAELGNGMLDLFINAKGLDLSKPGQSYAFVSALCDTKQLPLQKYFDAVFNHPTFNMKDSDNQKRNFWHFLALRRKFNASAVPESYYQNYFAGLSDETINEVDSSGNTPLMSNISTAEYGVDEFFLKRAFASPKLELNKISGDQSAMLMALTSRNSFGYAERLLKQGADTRNIGKVKPVSAKVLASLVHSAALYDAFINHPDLNINVSFVPVEHNYNQTIGLFSYLVRKKDYSKITALMADARFDDTAIAAHYRYTNGCSAVVVLISSDLSHNKLIHALLAKTPVEQLQNSCPLDGGNLNVLQRSAWKGNLPLVQYFYETLKIPQRYDRWPVESTAFTIAVNSKNWNVVDYFLSRGYTAELNGHLDAENVLNTEKPLMAELIRANEFALAKKLMAQPGFDINAGTKKRWDRSFILTAAEEDKKEFFDLLISHPKAKLGNTVLGRTRMGASDYYFEAALSKFRIQDATDKAYAIYIMQDMAHGGLPLANFNRVASLANFDINFVVSDEDYQPTTYTLYTALLRELNPVYLDPVLKMKGFNPAIIGTLHPMYALLFQNLLLVRSEDGVIKKYFDSYYAHPKIAVALPVFEGKGLFAILEGMGYDKERFKARVAALYFSNPKFKFTPEEFKLAYSYKNFFGEARYDEDVYYKLMFANGYLSHPMAKPLAQWSELIWMFSYRSPQEIEFLKKWEKDLDLNFTTGRKTLARYAVEEDRPLLFTYLMTNPKASVAGVLELVMQSYYGKKYREEFFSKRGKDIPVADVLEEIEDSLPRDKAPTAENLADIRFLIPYAKSFDKFTESSASFDDPAIIARLLKWGDSDPVLKTILDRVLKEDTTIAKYPFGVLEQSFARGRYDIVDLMIQRGYNIKKPIGVMTAMTYGATQKSLTILKYLASKGVGPDDRCAWGDRCDESYKNAFGVALNLSWYEGADYLISIGFQPRLVNPGESSLLYMARQNNTEAVKYLWSKGVTTNDTGALVAMLMHQNDELLKSVLSDAQTIVGERGYDYEMRRDTYPIIEAARYGRLDYVKAILAYPKVKKDIKDSLGYRAIDWAATNGYQDIVELLKQ